MIDILALEEVTLSAVHLFQTTVEPKLIFVFVLLTAQWANVDDLNVSQSLSLEETSKLCHFKQPFNLLRKISGKSQTGIVQNRAQQNQNELHNILDRNSRPRAARGSIKTRILGKIEKRNELDVNWKNLMHFAKLDERKQLGEFRIVFLSSRQLLDIIRITVRCKILMFLLSSMWICDERKNTFVPCCWRCQKKRKKPGKCAHKKQIRKSSLGILG